MIRPLSCLLVLLALPLATAFAQKPTKEDAERMAIGLYAASIPVDTCALDMTKDQEKRLEFWTDWAEMALKELPPSM